MRCSFVRFALLVLFIAGPSVVAAQSYTDFCPTGDEATEAAVVGWVTDPEAETVIPGAAVAASWVQDGSRQRVEAQTNLEGLYALCGLPRDVEVSLRAALADRRGDPVDYTTSDPLAQQDLLLSLTTEAQENNSEIGSLSRGGSGGKGRAYSAELIREEDLVHLPEMSVYELLRQHARLRFDRFAAFGEVILLSSVNTSLNSSTNLPVQVLINERREGDGVSAMRGMSIDEIKRIEILNRSEASARYGGDGWMGAIILTTRNR